jgi:hypothetical protein
MFTRNELVIHQKAFAEAKVRRFVPKWLALLVVAVALPFGVSATLQSFGYPEWIWISIAWVGIGAVPFWGWWGDMAIKRLQRACQVVCPHCDKPLVGMRGELAMTTGRCGGCGNVIVED